jgi:dTDP-glucose 4,6-dehydratase
LNNLQVTKELISIAKNVTKIGKKVKILFIKDRPGHDIRYALNSNKIRNKLRWRPRTNFRQGIKLTFEWYFKNKAYYKSLSKDDIINRLGKG